MDSFWYEAYRSFRKQGGFILTAIGAIVGIWAVYLPTAPALDIRWCLAFGLICYLVTATSIDLAVRALFHTSEVPRVVYALKDETGYQLLMTPSRTLAFDSVVSIFNLDGEFEVGVGWGRITNVQENGKLKVTVQDTYGKDDLWERICKPDKALMSSLLVKATIPSSALRGP